MRRTWRLVSAAVLGTGLLCLLAWWLVPSPQPGELLPPELDAPGAPAPSPAATAKSGAAPPAAPRGSTGPAAPREAEPEDLQLLEDVKLSGLDRLVAGSYRERVDLHAARAREAVDRYCADQAALADEPYLQPSPLRSDAGPYLNPRLRWEGGPEVRARLGLPERAELALPKEVHDTLASYGWLTYQGPLPSTAWMAGLHQYDHWSLGSALSGLTWDQWQWASIPNFVDLQAWTKIRWAQAFRDGGFAAAVADVRQIGRLSLSTQILMGAAVSAAILGIERRAYEEAVRRGMDVSGWEPIPGEQKDRMRRSAFLAMALAMPATPPEVLARAQACTRVNVMACAAWTEALPMVALLDALDPAGAAPHRASLARILASPPAGCDPRLLREAWETRGSTSTEAAIAVAQRLLREAPESFGGTTVFTTQVYGFLYPAHYGQVALGVSANPSLFGQFLAPPPPRP